MQQQPMGHQERGHGSTLAKEFFFGLIAVLLGAYNLLTQTGVLSWSVEIPQLIGNALLVLVGLLLWATAFKLWRHKYHTSRLF